MKKRYTEEQVVRILREYERGKSVVDLAREHGVSDQTIYRWKRKFGGMEVSDVKRFRELEKENAELKKLVADLSLERRALKDIVSKKW
jgi:putative transposase